MDFNNWNFASPVQGDILKRKYKHWITFLLISLLATKPACAQWGAELKEMIAQIAALEAYLQTAEKGYKIVEDGLHTIRDIKNGEFSLHSAFFASLKAVSPTVSGITDVSEIISLEASMISQLKSANAGFSKSGLLNAAELAQLDAVYQYILQLGTTDINFLHSLLIDGALSMTDGERIKRIETMDAQLKVRARFVQSALAQAKLLVTHRAADINDQATLKALYGIN